MIIDLIIKLLDRGIQLLKEHQKYKRDLFNDKILPIFNDFEMLHKNYIHTFEHYRKAIKGSNEFNFNHEVFDIIYTDHLFTKNIRSKISAAFKLFPENPYAYKIGPSGKLIPPSSKARKENDIEEFIHYIYSYFNTYQYLIFEDDHFIYSNSPRSSLVSGLKYIFSLDDNGIDEIKDLLKENPLIFLKNPQGNEGNFYKFGCFYSSHSSFASEMKPHGLWKTLLEALVHESIVVLTLHRWVITL